MDEKQELEMLRELRLRLGAYFRVKKSHDNRLPALIRLKEQFAAIEERRISTAAPDAAECSFIELNCHKCGAIIDVTLAQMPHR